MARDQRGTDEKGNSFCRFPGPNLTPIPACRYRTDYQGQTGYKERQRSHYSLVSKHMLNRGTLFMRGDSVRDPTKRPRRSPSCFYVPR